MASDSERWRASRRRDCLVKRPAVGHERGRSHNTGLVRFDNGAVNARGQAEIVSINDETAHAVSLAACPLNCRMVESGGACFLGLWLVFAQDQPDSLQQGGE